MTRSTVGSAWANRLDAVAAHAVGALPAILFLGLLLVLAWRLAVWFWVLVPPPFTTAAPVKVVEGGAAAARHWFGEAVLAAPGPASPGGAVSPVASTAGEYRLLGVISGGRRSAAMIAVGKTTHDVLVGETFADGVRLQAVAVDHVMLDKQGWTIRVDLPGAAGAAVSGPAGMAGSFAGLNASAAPTAGMPTLSMPNSAAPSSATGVVPAAAPPAYSPAAEPGVPVHNAMRRPETAARKP